jgi:hypothetical protein
MNYYSNNGKVDNTPSLKWDAGIIIDWDDTIFKKNQQDVEVLKEYWIWDMYVVETKTGWWASTDGRIGLCPCPSFRKHKPTEKGKTPCKHLWKCRDSMELNIREKVEYKEHKRKYMKDNRKRKDTAICEHLKKAKGDPNSLLNDEKFVKKMIKGENYV